MRITHAQFMADPSAAYDASKRETVVITDDAGVERMAICCPQNINKTPEEEERDAVVKWLRYLASCRIDKFDGGAGASALIAAAYDIEAGLHVT